MDGEGNPTHANQEQNRGAQNQGNPAHSWEAINNGFFEVQKILQENKLLIGEINHNQESKMPNNIARNVALIKELNSNMTQVVGLYSNLSSSFVSYMEEEAAQKRNSEQEKMHSDAVAPTSGTKGGDAT
jgi:hypothetical protein